ncbi:Cyt-b5 domain-containing protein/Oxidored_molyb domain-containing protein/NAD_binding_1 domain-containing protein/FAD_binding_6 domain-containing protein/Mo-co_dimer domain-containing protein [Cephalotus follicularis]|uniref:Nitrate reductase n=1 Tax=Cephalotus follicularis TaxID=3775 RepID=A0A1Q3C7H7_CEPFO|nr:Cyt-b5 domain-containing protein/Oxidored_molyb domain-containing protein/NAD_binding_1 domain-containing protein/FAD_binding_6 domain-containing protein/Mo-co_dimer domain-containing protein [Cephalotus follicularis]
MAALVNKHKFTHLEPSLNGVVLSFKSGPNHHMFPSKEPDESSSDEDECDYKQIITKTNHQLEQSVLDPRDELTADNWIERNPSMIRLTGKHPFNSEPPLNRLMHHGFITPVQLHYIRNHGPVPKSTWEEWTVEVTGLVKRPARFTMDQLVNDFPKRELPVTLVCAGNRRKEQNMVKQTIGFNWGPAGVSTSVWRGVPLCYVLKRCGIYSRKSGALNVCFEGAEDLPGGGGSKYGTSISKEYAMDPSLDIILAYMQNGEVLTPDHGFPLRVIIPGFIGGRMVKWLKRIIVTTKESDSFYHYNDNRVLPSHVVDAGLANSQAWWYKPEYIINELNINSVIATPCHQEILSINSRTTQTPYTMRGYAYSGGGKKVTRVEVTMDGGETWHVCTLEHPEKPNKYGKYWCWCFWSLEVEVMDLIGAKEIAVRAWDQSLNTQPEKLIWNLMGMMNNCWFRVKTNVCKSHIVFEHPTLPANQSGGWMAKECHLEKYVDTNQTLKKSGSSPFNNTSSKTFSISEVKQHNSADSAWIIVHGHIYDCTRFLKDHPGGADSILINSGTDCTEEFDAIHSDKAKIMLEDYRIGKLMTTSPDSSMHSASNMSHLAPIKEVVPTRSVALVPGEKIPCKLIEKRSISHNVRLFRFSLPSEDQVLGLPVGKHIFLCATIDAKLCIRAYTPSSAVDVKGYFDLVVKIYFKGVHPKFPNGGLMSQYLDSLPLGSILEVKGPLGHIEYSGRGNFSFHGKPKFAKKLAMLAGGTGITPIYQVIQAILKDPEDDTEMYLVYCNRTEVDILLREELDAWAAKHDRLKVWYVVQESIREGWLYSVGKFIEESILRERIPEGSDDTLALACGPPPMIQFAVQPNLEKMNYDIKNQLLLF